MVGVAPRGAPNGPVTRHGRLVVRRGDTRQGDMTFSIAKSCLSILGAQNQPLQMATAHAMLNRHLLSKAESGML